MEIDSSHPDCIFIEGQNSKVLCVHAAQALCRMLVSSMLFCPKLVKDSIKCGFTINPSDPCISNKMANFKQLTLSWHMDDPKAIHADSKVMNQFLQWIVDMDGSIGKVKTTRGKMHDCLGMKLDCTFPGHVTINMKDHATAMLEAFPSNHLKAHDVVSPWSNNQFKVMETAHSSASQ